MTEQKEKRIIAIHYSEIALKGTNRKQYETKLIKNAEKILNQNIKIKRRPGRLLIYLDDTDNQQTINIINKLKKVFGIKWIGEGYSIPKDIDSLKETAVKIAKQHIKPDETFRIKATRVDKSYSLTSLEIEREIGAEIIKQVGARVNLKNPQKTLYISILPSETIIIWNRHEGPGGLPVGTSGRVLSLFSGGIDSPVASWLMMKRGCRVDLLHFYALPSIEQVRISKIVSLFEVLKNYSPDLRLFLASFIPFMKASMSADPRIELPLFRRFILKVAEKLAMNIGALGIVTGDSLGQVASQTLDNLYSASVGISLPIYRPLIGMDKEEITELAKKIGTYSFSIMEYKDCCSILVRSPSTKCSPAELMDEWNRLGLDGAVEETLASIEELKL
ncbi:MAG: tRNA uracil 4-sulfurtransferase ThiI [Nitrososphaerota archaeon]